MSTEQDDTEADYGSWDFTVAGALAEEKRLNPILPPPDILPDWSDGVPTLVRWSGMTERFWKDKVRYEPRPITVSVEYEWCLPENLSELRSRYGRLPTTDHWEWSGVYHLFAANQSIDRLLGKDATGIFYFGMAGDGPKRWSIMRDRIKGLATRRSHHVADHWYRSDKLQERFPWETPMIQWAFTMRKLNYKGEETSGARTAEG